MKILIATPCMEHCHVRFVQSLEMLERVGSTKVCFTENSLVYAARESLVNTALENDTDYVLFVDSDMVFPSDALKKLLADKKDIVSGLCFRRRPPYTPAMWKTIRLGEEHIEEEYTDYPKDSLFEADAYGMAFCLIKTKVLRDVTDRYHACYQPLRGYGEDISFCIRAKQLGYKLWVDSRVKIGHVGTCVITESTYSALHKKEYADACNS